MCAASEKEVVVDSILRIIVTGLIAQYPLGGVAWDYLQYVLGAIRLGHDVYYIEDSGQWPYNPIEGGLGKDGAYNADYLAGIMSRFGLTERWAYHFPGGALPGGEIFRSEWFGLSDKIRRDVVRSADLLINVSSGIGNVLRYDGVQRLAYIDTDPVFTQIRLLTERTEFRNQVDAHHLHFSYGECLPETVVSTGHRWRPTRSPIVLSEWNPSVAYREVFTTVMNWTSFNDVTYRGQLYGQKDVEFYRFLELPTLVYPTALELAVNPAGNTRSTPWNLLLQKGWRLVDPAKVCPDLDSYRRHIETSMAEWSVAKNGYVIGQPGWFSERSACYLAAGKPVVVQDTGFPAILPVGEGILPFRTIDEAAAAIHQVRGNYARQAKAARVIAEEYFDSDKVLTHLIKEAMNSVT